MSSYKSRSRAIAIARKKEFMSPELLLILAAAFLIVFTFASKSRAASGACDHILTHYDNLQISRDTFENTNVCYVSIHPMNVKSMKYRDYLLTSENFLMVFNSYGDGPASHTTGAREFYFFPRQTKALARQMNVIPKPDEKEVVVEFSEDLKVAFSTVTAQIKWVSHAQVSVANDINSKNNGGVEITDFQGLMMDVGFAMGQSPASEKKHSSLFTNAKGAKCSVTNDKIFDYSNDDIKLTMNDSQVSQLIDDTCQGL